MMIIATWTPMESISKQLFQWASDKGMIGVLYEVYILI